MKVLFDWCEISFLILNNIDLSFAKMMTMEIIFMAYRPMMMTYPSN